MAAKRVGQWLGGAAAAIARWVFRFLTWPLRRPGRLLSLAWLVGFFAVGSSQVAWGDDLIVGPGAPTGAAPTPFESVPLSNYQLPVMLSDSHHGAPYVQETMWNLIGAVSNVLIYLTLSLLRGAIVCMQWMLQLNLFRENQAAIDSAVMNLANEIFWPLFATTLAIAGLVMYARKNREGGGSIVNDFVWVVAASILAITFAGIPGSAPMSPAAEQACKDGTGDCIDPTLGPSRVMGDLDDLRRLIATGAIRGFSSAAPVSTSAAGFPAVNYDSTSKDDGTSVALGTREVNSVRKLANSMWNVYAVTPWCYAMFNSIAACKHDTAGVGEGAHYLLRDSTWDERATFLNDNGKDGDQGNESKCPSEWSSDPGKPTPSSQCDWIRGQSYSRLGVVALTSVTSLPTTGLLLALVMFGVMAIVGFILLLLSGLLFLLGWMIPGRLRQIGIRWFEAALGSLLQSVIITTVLGAVMVLGGILNEAIPQYGYFMVVLLNIATFVVGFRLRGHFESITQLSGPGSSSPLSSYMAMKMLSGIGRGVRGAGRGLSNTAAEVGGAARGAGRGAAAAGRFFWPKGAAATAATGSAQASTTLAPLRSGAEMGRAAASRRGSHAWPPSRGDSERVVAGASAQAGAVTLVKASGVGGSTSSTGSSTAVADRPATGAGRETSPRSGPGASRAPDRFASRMTLRPPGSRPPGGSTPGSAGGRRSSGQVGSSVPGRRERPGERIAGPTGTSGDGGPSSARPVDGENPARPVGSSRRPDAFRSTRSITPPTSPQRSRPARPPSTGGEAPGAAAAPPGLQGEATRPAEGNRSAPPAGGNGRPRPALGGSTRSNRPRPPRTTPGTGPWRSQPPQGRHRPPGDGGDQGNAS